MLRYNSSNNYEDKTMSNTLVLNADYSPLSIIPISTINWKEAVKLSFLGSAKVLEEYSDWVVRSPSISMHVPSVMVSSEYIKKKHYVRFSRYNLMLRDNFTCQYCHKVFPMQELTIDHVVPRARGGVTSWTNCVASCYQDNLIKGHRTNMKPKNKPHRPDYYELLNNARLLPIIVADKAWIQYLQWDESLVTIKPPNKLIH
jgi:5-methylcytosine-specific restriction endonuclease McrA